MPTRARREKEAAAQALAEAAVVERLRAAYGHDRYHQAQADRTIDTAAKRLARRAGLDQVQCPCGAVFPSAVEGK